MILIWKLEVNIKYVPHKPQGISFSFEPIFAEGKKQFLSKAPLKRGRESVRVGVLEAGAGHVWRRRSQQVHSAVIQEVGCAVGSGLHHLVLVNHLDRLVIDAQPAVQTDLEDVCRVMATRRAAAVMVDHCKESIGSVAFKVLIFNSWRKQF